MKFKAPKGATSVSIGGETINVDKKGFITLPDDGNYDALLAPHGYTKVAAEEVAEEEDATKQAPPAPTGKGK